MRVLHFYKTYIPDTIGGIEQVINQITRGVGKHGVVSDVLTLTTEKNSEVIEVDGHKVHRCRSGFEIASTPFSIAAFSKFRELAKEADIIHYHFPYPFADILHFFTSIKKPALVSYHSDIVKQKYLLKIYSPLQNYFLGSVEHIVAATPNYLESSKVLSKFKDKCSVIPYGLDKDSYPVASTERLSYWRDKFEGRFFLFVGVLRYYKGLQTLIDAAKGTVYPIVIVGSGPVEVELKVQLVKLGISNVYFVGQQLDEDKVALLNLCYAFVFPSHLRSEAFGISLLEAAMYGKPLISCEIGTGTTYINIDKETGVVVPPNDPFALREAMAYLWNNPDEASSMGKRAESRYWNIFTAKKMAQSYMLLYERLLNGSRNHKHKE